MTIREGAQVLKATISLIQHPAASSEVELEEMTGWAPRPYQPLGAYYWRLGSSGGYKHISQRKECLPLRLVAVQTSWMLCRQVIFPTLYSAVTQFHQTSTEHHITVIASQTALLVLRWKSWHHKPAPFANRRTC